VPKPTFAQISSEKRERILRSAAEVFGELGFSGADVGKIAEKAGVAKGSLYNYFTSKEELYLFVCRDGLERSRKAVYEGIEPGWDIYKKIDHLFRSGVTFAVSHPEYIRLYINVSSAGMDRFADQLTLEVEKYTSDYLKKIINEGIENGSVYSDVDPNLAAFLINSLYVMFVVSLISRHFQIRIKEYLAIDGDISEKSIEEHLSEAINIVKRLLRPR
jgi:AcrR family transcriptional regulator